MNLCLASGRLVDSAPVGLVGEREYTCRTTDPGSKFRHSGKKVKAVPAERSAALSSSAQFFRFALAFCQELPEIRSTLPCRQCGGPTGARTPTGPFSCRPARAAPLAYPPAPVRM